MSDIPLNIRLSAVGGAGVLSAVSSIASAFGSGGLGGALLATGVAATVAAVAIGTTAAKATGDYQAGLTSLATGAGESTKNLGMVGDAMLKMAVDTGTSTKSLVDGMYMIESGGYHGAAGLAILQAAAQGAKVGNADLGVVADATDTVLKNFGGSGLTAANAVNTLIATVARGKTHMSDLSASLSQVLPTASAARVGLNDVMGAMSTMTGEGIPAANAATYLRQMLIALQAPSAGSVKALKAIGLTTADVSTEMHKSLPSALQMITDRLKTVYGEGTPEYLAAVKNISGGSKTMQGMLDLTGTHLATFKDDVSGIAGAVKQGGSSIVGWSLVQDTFNQKVAQGKEIIETLGIRLGQLLLPAATNVMNTVLPLASNFSSLFTAASPLTPVFSQISGMFGIMKANWQNSAPAFAPVMQAFRGFGSLVSGLLPGALSQFLRALNDVNTVIGTVAVAVAGWISPALSIMGQAFKGVQAGMEPVLNAIEGQLLPAFQNLVTAIAPIVTHILQWIANSGVITPLLTGLGFAVSFVVKFVSGLVNVLASVITFFTQTQVGVSILQAVLVTLGVVLGVIAAVVLPGLIAGFVATAISAIATGISIALAFLPITLIVLGIIVVVALVILAIKNLGAISSWLKGAWSNVAAFFVGIWKDITGAFGNAGQWFQDRFKQASDGVKSGFGAVGAFFSNAWKGVQQVFGNVGNWFKDRFKQASDGVKSGFGTAGNWFQQQGNNIKNAALNMGQGVINASNWMYQHNTYYAAMVDKIKSVVSGAEAWLASTWNNIKSTAIAVWNNIKTGAVSAWTSTINFIKGLWAGLSSTARSVWNAVSSAIMTAVNTIIGWVKVIWNTEVNGLSIIWHSLSDFASSAWNAVSSTVMSAVNTVIGWLTSIWNNEINSISIVWHGLTGIAQLVWSSVTGVFQSAWGGISGALSGLWSNISGWFTNIAGQMVQFGENLINSLAQGITNAAGAVTNAASGVASNIAKFLGFHSPAEEGPASDADKWMPNFVTMLSNGLLNSQPMLQLAITATAKSLTALASITNPSTVADQLSFTQAPTSISQSTKAPVATTAVKKETAQDKKEVAAEKKAEAQKQAEEKKAEAAAKAKEKKTVNADIGTIKAELHIHTATTKLDKAQIDEIIAQSMSQFGVKIGDEIRAQFGNI